MLVGVRLKYLRGLLFWEGTLYIDLTGGERLPQELSSFSRLDPAGGASTANVLARLNELRAGFADDVYKTEFVQIVSLAEESGFYGAQEQENDAR